MERLDDDPCSRLALRRLTVDGTDFALTVTDAQCRKVYLPLARLILHRAEACGSARFMIGLAGPPGAGKTAAATILAALLRDILGGDAVVVVPLDGFHYPNMYLDAHVTDLPNGERVSLRSLKGRPCSFDGDRALAAFEEIRNGGEVSLPIYSRELHEPVEGALRVEPRHTLVLVEGNFLFLDSKPWKRIRGLFDLKVFVTEERELLEHRLLERHMRGGTPEDDARRRIARVDAVNMDDVSGSKRFADVVISPEARRLELI